MLERSWIDKPGPASPYWHPFMKTLLLALTGLIALAPLTPLSVQAADAASDKKIDAVLDRYTEAMGGRAAIEKVTSRIMKASFEGQIGRASCRERV